MKIAAEGARAAADDLQANPVAVELARLDRMGSAFGGSSYFFGADPNTLTNGLAAGMLTGAPMMAARAARGAE